MPDDHHLSWAREDTRTSTTAQTAGQTKRFCKAAEEKCFLTKKKRYLKYIPWLLETHAVSSGKRGLTEERTGKRNAQKKKNPTTQKRENNVRVEANGRHKGPRRTYLFLGRRVMPICVWSGSQGALSTYFHYLRWVCSPGQEAG